MAQKFSSKKRAFTYGEHLVIIQDGKFSPIDLDEERFKEIIDDILNYEKNCITADLVLQNAMKRYTGIYVFERVFEGTIKSDSEFYNTWKDYIFNLEKFQIINPRAYENYQKKRIEIRKKSNTEAFLNNCESDSIFRACSRIK